jgi:hypothetical protein
VTLVITTCTNRKRKPVSEALHMAALPPADFDGLARQWSQRLAAEPTRFPGEDIYGGRGFREAVTAAELLDARLLVVSAGLGLIDVSTAVPPYACTVLVDAPDSVRSRVTGAFSVERWWEALCKVSPFAVALHDAVEDAHGPICAALSDAYIEMIAEDLLALPTSMLGRLRLFTRARLDRVPAALQPFVMPYDDRLDGPDSSNRGTRSDFAGRALRHFAELTRGEPQGRSAAEHAAEVSAALDGWRMLAKVDRIRYDDAALLDLIRAHWDAECGSSSRLLRRFRDDLGIACEQGRFAELARQVRNERA